MLRIAFRNGVKRQSIIPDSRLDFRSFSQSFKRLNEVEIKLKRAEEGYLANPHLRILSSPLRRCQASMMVLPKLMMFKLVSYKNSSEEAQFPLKKELQEEVNRLRTKEQHSERTHRWILRQAKKALTERLERETKMLKHKIVTCQTEKSRTKFTIELEQKKKELGYMYIPKGFRKIGYDLEGLENHFQKINKRGQSKWCFLDVDAALALFDKRTFFSSDKNLKPDGFLSNIGEMLEKDLINTVKYLSTVNFEDEQMIWRGIREKTEAETCEELSAVVQTDSSISTDTVNTQNTASPILYHIDQLFDQDDLKSEAFEALQAIVTRSQAQAGSKTDPFVIRKHKLTTNLCVALWRLNQWRESMAKKK